MVESVRTYPWTFFEGSFWCSLYLHTHFFSYCFCFYSLICFGFSSISTQLCTHRKRAGKESFSCYCLQSPIEHFHLVTHSLSFIIDESHPHSNTPSPEYNVGFFPSTCNICPFAIPNKSGEALRMLHGRHRPCGRQKKDRSKQVKWKWIAKLMKV